MSITPTQMTDLSANQKAWARRWNEQITAWHATLGAVMQTQLNHMAAQKDLALVAALTDIVRIIRGEAPLASGQGYNTTTGSGGIGGEKIATKAVKEPTGAVDKHGQPVVTTYKPIWSYRFPYLNKTRLLSGGDGVWRVILDDTRTKILGIFDYHGSGMAPWRNEGISPNTAS